MPDLAPADTDFQPSDFDFAGARVDRGQLGCEIVTMMQTSESRHGNHVRIDRRALCGRSASRSFFAQAEMSSVVMIVVDIFPHETFQMTLIQHNDMFKQIASAVPTNRSAIPFCQGLRIAVRTGRMPKLIMVSNTSPWKVCSRSKIRYLGADS